MCPPVPLLVDSKSYCMDISSVSTNEGKGCNGCVECRVAFSKLSIISILRK